MKSKNKFIIFFILIIFFYIIFFLELNTNYLNPINIAKDIVIYPFKMINNALNYGKDTKINNILLDNSSKEELVKEIDELKRLLDVRINLSDFKIINATVLSRNKNYWFNTLIIDKGTKDGVLLNMAVVTSKGLIGRIEKVTDNTSQIKMISSNDINNKISVVVNVNNNNVYGLINGYDQDKNLLSIMVTNKLVDIPSGTIIKTSGMGGVFPSSIIVGNVKEVVDDKYNTGKIIRATPTVDLSTIRFVAVLKRVNND